MIKVLALTKYGPLAASTRQRFLQYQPWLAAADISVEVSPLLDDAYLRQRFGSGAIGKRSVIVGYLRRLKALATARRFDVIWVHIELFPFLPGFFERLVRLSGKPVIYDFDDAVFHNYNLQESPILRAILGRKLEPLARTAVKAFCGNIYLQAWAKQFCDDAIVIPTVVDIAEYVPAVRAAAPVPCIGWIGSPSTFEYVVPLLPLLEALAAAGRATVTVIGSGRPAGQDRGIDYVDWAEATEIAMIQAMDIGLMPLPETPWARGKCGYKLIQYLACGVPVIASPVGVNADIVEVGVNGLLAASEHDWQAALETLLTDPARRTRNGDAGRARIVRDFSLQRYAPEVVRHLAEAARPR